MNISFLPRSQLLEVLALPSKRRKELFIQVIMDEQNKILWFVNGNFEMFHVPFFFFTRSGNGTLPDFEQLRMIDHGHAVTLGSYEVSSKAIIEYHRNFSKG